MSEKSNYEVYRKTKSKEEYFGTWTKDSLEKLTSEALKNAIYDKYVIKCGVLQRDGFKCRNVECSSPNSPLTMHHVRFQKNGGKDSIRNCVTLCRSCHKGFHTSGRSIVFDNSPDLPSIIRGHTFRLNRLEEMDWKKFKAEMKTFRKNLKAQGFKSSIKWESVFLLLSWVFTYADEFDD